MNKFKYLYRWDLLFIKLKLLYKGYFKLKKDKEYWDNIKGKYKGRRGFVIGNGPSLIMEDLQKLYENNEITIASNKISLAFDNTQWRPDIYTIADALVWDKIKNEIHKDIEIVHTRSSVNYLNSNKEVKLWKRSNSDINSEELIKFSSNPGKTLYAGWTVTYENLQIAIHLGLNPIYIIGCDHYYHGEDTQNSSKIIHKKNIDNHFIKGYRKTGEVAGKANIREMTLAYKSARDYAENNETRIINATRGGHLEVFERVNFDNIFK